MRRRDRKGFTIVELLTVMLIIGILASMAMLRYMDLTNEALAGKVGQEMQQIRIAAIAYYAEQEVFPPSAAAGMRPLELDPLLSDATQFSNPAYTLEWVNQAEDLVGKSVAVTRGAISVPPLRNRFGCLAARPAPRCCWWRVRSRAARAREAGPPGLERSLALRARS